MINFLWSLIEVMVWSIWQIVLMLFALGIYRGWSKEKDEEEDGHTND